MNRKIYRKILAIGELYGKNLHEVIPFRRAATLFELGCSITKIAKIGIKESR